MQLSGKTALVTGGTDGIGAELIRQLRAKGVTVITHGRNAERVTATRSAGFEVIAADLSKPEGVKTLADAVAGRTIDILVNNAGAGVDHDFRIAGLSDLAAVNSTVFLNLNAPIHLITELMGTLKARPEALIVNVTSGLAIAPMAGSPVYCATKAALRSYTMALRAQLKDTHVRVLEVLPPVVDTRMTAALSSGKLPVAECARQIISAMERGTDEANVGQVKMLRVLESISPALVRRFMLRF